MGADTPAMDRRTFLRGGVPLALVALAGCTDGEESPTGETPAASPTDTAGASPSPTGGSGGGASKTPTDASTGTATDEADGEPSATDVPTSSPPATEAPPGSPSPDQEVVVGPDGTLTFQPRSFTIAAGDTVLWRWDSGGHNVSPTEGAQPDGADWSGKDRTTYPSGTTYTYTFYTAGDYEYHCDPHQSVGMVGSFTVE